MTRDVTNYDPYEEAYEAALHRYGDTGVRITTTVLDLTILIATVRPALRFPHVPDHIRDCLTAFVETALAQLRLLSPDLADGVERESEDPMA